MTRSEVWCVVAGGGTAGHVHPGLAIADELVRRGHTSSSILFVGSERGVDETLVPAAGFDLVTLPGRGIQRRLTVQNLGAVLGLARGFVRAVRLLLRVRPEVVVSLGGYASVPCAVAAFFLRVPVVIAEQNAVPGAANRLVSRWARSSAVSFASTDLPHATYTGNPVRDEMLAVDRERDQAAAREALGVGADRQLLCAYGGSLGSRRINAAVAGACGSWADRKDLSIRHVIGSRDWEDFRSQTPVTGAAQLEYRVVEYEWDMASVMAAADLVLCRAGATSVAELTVAGTPAVLVPLPGAPGDHQTANATALSGSGAAVQIADADLTAAALVELVDSLLGDPERLAQMSHDSRQLGRPNAAAAVADLVENESGGGRG